MKKYIFVFIQSMGNLKFMQVFLKKIFIAYTPLCFLLKVYFQNVHASVHNILLWENLAVGVLFIGKPWWMKGVAIMIFFLS